MRMRTFVNVALVAGVFAVWTAGYAQTTAAPLKSPDKKIKTTSGPAAAVTKDTAGVGADSSTAADSLAVRLFTIRVATQPESAQVFLNDSLRGVSPCSVSNVIPGAHQLVLKKVGCYLKKAQIVVDSATPREYSFTLLQPAFIRLESEPQGAEVAINGEKKGITPWESDKIKPGDYTIRMDLATYRPVEKKVTAESAGRDTIRTVLVHTEEYQDSVAAAQLAETRAKRAHFNGMLASGLFIIGALVVVVLELMND